MFAKSEVSQFDVPMLVEENIIRFQISVNVVHFVHGFDGKDGLGNIESTFLLRKHILAHQKSHKVTARQKVHHQVQILLILE